MDYTKISILYKTPATLVKVEHEKILADLRSQGGLTEDEIIKSSEELTHLFFRNQAKSKGELYQGIIFGYDACRDTANPHNKPSRRTLAVEAYTMDPTGATEKGTVAVLENIIGDELKLKRTYLDKKTKTVLTDTVYKDNVKELIIPIDGKYVLPLDDIEKWGTGSENLSYLRPLPLHVWTTKIEGIVRDGKGYKRFEMNYQRPTPLGDLPMYVPVDFKAIPKNETNGVLNLNASTYTQFVLSTTTMGAEPLKLLEEGFKSLKQQVSTLHEYHARLKNKYDSLVLVEGWVSNMRLEGTMPSFTLDDLNSEPIKVLLHDGIPINFGTQSKVLVLGRTSVGDKWTAETGVQKGVPGDLTIFAIGVYSKFNSKPTNVRPVDNI